MPLPPRFARALRAVLCAVLGTAAAAQTATSDAPAVPTASSGAPGGWNRFRGPNGQGALETATLPLALGQEGSLRWKTAVPAGHSSPVYGGDRLFLTACEPRGLVTLAYDRDSGKLLWRKAVPETRQVAFHALNNAASSTPAVSPSRVYVYFGTFGLVCYTQDGDEVWRRPLDTPSSKYGMATSPILHRDAVVLALDGDDGSSRLLALRQDDGETLWEQPRPLFKAGWSTPMILHHPERDELIVLGSKRLTAYDPATGRELWWAGGFPDETVGVPVAGDGLLFASGAALGGRGDDHLDAAATWKTTVDEFDRNHDRQIQRAEMAPGFAFIQRPELPKDNPGYGLPVRDMETLLKIFDHDTNRVITESEWMRTMAGFASISHPVLAAIRPGARGDARPDHVAWELRRGIPETSSLLHHRGRLYLMRDGGLLTCLRASTGAELFRERIGAAGQYIASPVAAGDRILLASAPGVVTVIEAADTLRVLARHDLQEEIFSTPALAPDCLYLRTAQHLYAFGQCEHSP